MKQAIENAAQQLAEADLILIGAGAGMSVDAGYDYNERDNFLRSYPYLEKIGVHCRYHSIGFPWPSKTIQWAFYARHLQDVLYTHPPKPLPYRQLDVITQHADRRVLTSNADNLFREWASTRNGSGRGRARTQICNACGPARSRCGTPSLIWMRSCRRSTCRQAS